MWSDAWTEASCSQWIADRSATGIDSRRLRECFGIERFETSDAHGGIECLEHPFASACAHLYAAAAVSQEVLDCGSKLLRCAIREDDRAAGFELRAQSHVT